MSTKKTSPGKQRLLDFLKRLLEDDNDIIVWTDRQNAEFRMVKPHAVAEKWGAITGNPSMNYDKMSRGLRHFYTNNTLKKMPGKDSRYRFLEPSPSLPEYLLKYSLNLPQTSSRAPVSFNIDSLLSENATSSGSAQSSPTSSTSTSSNPPILTTVPNIEYFQNLSQLQLELFKNMFLNFPTDN